MLIFVAIGRMNEWATIMNERACQYTNEYSNVGSDDFDEYCMK